MLVVSVPASGSGHAERDVEVSARHRRQVSLLHRLAAVPDHGMHPENRQVEPGSAPDTGVPENLAG